MANYGAKILNNAISSLNAQQALIANASNNIANVNTEGFTRRTVDLQSKAGSTGLDAGLQVGSGVDIASVKRISDSYLEELLRAARGDSAEATLSNDYLARLQEYFPLDGSGSTISTSLNDFFAALNRVSVNPASLDLRLNLLQRGEDLVLSIRETYDAVASLQKELDDRLPTEIDAVNSITQQIADLNSVIGQREAAGQTALDERDQRDIALQQLTEKLSVKVIEGSNGMVGVFLENGFPLVNGPSSRELSVTAAPTFGGSTMPASLSGDTLSYVVYDYGTSAASSHIDLTQLLKSGSGVVAGLLQMRGHAAVSNTTPFQADGTLVAVASRIEALTRSLLVDANLTYMGGAPGGAGDLNGASPGPFSLFDFTSTAAKDADGDGIPEHSDLNSAALGISNFSSIIKFGISTPQGFAAARDADTNPATTTFQPGDGRNAQALEALRTTSVNFSIGSFTFTGTYNELYSNTVSYIGNSKSAAETDARIADQTLTMARNRRDEVSGVSLDEEFANLIKYQKAFQASARLMRTVGDLLDQIVNLL